jgi:hypothetical protein
MRVVAEGDKLRARWLDPEPAYDTERAKLKELG